MARRVDLCHRPRQPIRRRLHVQTQGPEVATKVTEKAVQILGGHGYLTDHPAEKWYSDPRVLDIFEGTSQIQRMVIARALPEANSPLPLRRGHG